MRSCALGPQTEMISRNSEIASSRGGTSGGREVIMSGWSCMGPTIVFAIDL